MTGAATSPTAPGRPWLARWQTRHTQCMVVATPVAILMLTRSDPSPAALAVMLALGGGVLGVPHGALDHLLGRALLAPRWGRWWPAVLFPGYLALASSVLVAWQVAPVATLLLFLAATALHFGTGDVATPPPSTTSTRATRSRPAGAQPWVYILEVGVRGTVMLIVMAWRFPAELAQGIGWTLPAGAVTQAVLDAWVRAAAARGIAVLVPALAVVIVHCGVAAVRHRDPDRALTIAELGALSLLFACVPPIPAFVVYFCFWHSARHVLRVAATLDPFDARRGLVGFAWHALPLTAVTLVAMAIAWRSLATPAAPLATTTRVVFQGLSALTFPHMVITAISARRGAWLASPAAARGH
jgi:Brp/Blh family beta-carotene 15,15'-monooxygenase